jgi:hypothetical protein
LRREASGRTLDRKGTLMARQSYSQSGEASGAARWVYLWQLGLLYLQRVLRPADFSGLDADLASYEQLYTAATGRRLLDAKVLELGFGQRPFRLMLLQSLGCEARGIDLDQPLYRISAGAVAHLFGSNGLRRAAKSLIRSAVFDRIEYRRLAAHIRRRHGHPLRFDASAMIVGDLVDPAAWRSAGAAFDFIYSEDVFEHIPRDALPQVLALLSDALGENAIAVISPMIFTGISGGHDIDWYPHRVDGTDTARPPAWGHLTGEAAPGDTYLNRMTRGEFRALFGERFEILSEQPLMPELGRRHLTDERRRKLAAFDEDELFSNKVRFVLRNKAG